MNNKTDQYVAMTFYLRYQYMFRKQKCILDIVGATIGGYVRVEKGGECVKKLQEVEVTLSGLLAASYFVGM